MSADKKLPKYNAHDQYLWVDHIEVLCLLDLDEQMSASQYTDHVSLKKKEDTESNDFEDDDSLSEETKGNDKEQHRTNSLFSFFTTRSHRYQEFYPFEYDQKELLLKVRDDAFTDTKKLLYIYLLCCSHLKWWSKYKPTLTSDFEQLAGQVVKQLVQKDSTVHVVGKNTLGEQNYTGNLFTKLKSIATDLNENLEVAQEDFSKQNSGDGGLDILGWTNVGDELKSKLLFTGQAKCSIGWSELKSAGTRLKQFMSLNNAPNDFYFIPFCFRNISNKWHEHYKTKDLILVDRYRILKIIKPIIDELPEQIPSLEIIPEIFQQKVLVD